MSNNISSSQNLSLLKITNCRFDSDVHFDIYGLITFKSCQFTSAKLIFSILQTINEFKHSDDNLAKISSYAASHKIQVLQCNFTSEIDGMVIFHVHEVW